MLNTTLKWKFSWPRNQSAPAWFGLGASVGSFSEMLLCFHSGELKASLIKNRSHLLSGWPLAPLCGPCSPTDRGMWLFVVLIMESWDTLSGLLRAHKNSPVYPQTHFRSLSYWSCIAILFPRHFIPYFLFALSIIRKVKGNKKTLQA